MECYSIKVPYREYIITLSPNYNTSEWEATLKKPPVSSTGETKEHALKKIKAKIRRREKAND